ncbi:TetR family transcriptional regulator C-terminal domain-containing protein [Methylobacterium sp. SyP6R]|uniref:TetR family transcriptional regulator C-terminal domain-containing protein n=1 Tax=Methylobacterium sp. SyP6R TaxID=2718876 RepID=UPI001F204AE0|nr:TetR family transcriptional regulator C-terminal domain-containing protein [Methylobacterium sp. SyP6R]MCF4123909.1 TetR/AcrR family transcriptional regulator [Methylobacterium sp. SyP6R]
MARRDTREILIAEGLKAFLARGYEGIGIQPILSGAGVPKGSFYNFFPSKEAYALEIVDAYAARYEAFRLACFAADGSPLQRMRGYFEALEAEMEGAGETAGCLYGVLAQTSAPHSEALRSRLKAAFANWRSHLADLLDTAKAAGELAPATDTVALADAIIDAYEGAAVRMRAEGNTAPMRRFRERTMEALLSAHAACDTREPAP